MPTHDVLIYGATPMAVFAAIVIARAGRTVGIVAPETALGGMITGGLGITDAAAERNWYGVTKEFVDAVKAVTGFTNDRLSWNFAPSVAQTQIDAMVAAEANITLYLGQTITAVERTETTSTPLGRLSGNVNRGDQIRSIKTASGTYDAAAFIDASYTGELMHQAGVPYDLGREPISFYGEPNAGVYTDAPVTVPRDYVNADGDLMRYAQFMPLEKGGDPDRKTMGCGFRYAVTNVPANRVAWPAPPGYNAADFADDVLFAQRHNPTIRDVFPGFLFRRDSYDAALAEEHVPGWADMTQTARETAWHQFTGIMDGVDRMALVPGKFLTNGSDIISPMAWEYTTANEARRAEIRTQLVYRELGRFHTFANHPDVPVATRNSWNDFGLCADEFQTHFTSVQGVPHELYHRQGRRIRGQARVDFWDTAYQTNHPDQIAFGGYFVDSKAKTQYAPPFLASTLREGTYRTGPGRTGDFVTSDGVERDWEAFVYFGIPMQAVVPPRGVCDNLAVVWSLSSTDIAFTAIRLEPFLAAVAEAVGHMAVESVVSGTTFARLNYAPVRARLDSAGAVLYRYGVPS